ncbi:MAG: radical SAM family heme chaperone HemW [Clostridia bacterium]|nr:radical SAM family heme chaperone HemW [Clostridia bacterium]
MDGNKTLGVYLHIPFCLSKCPYCDFCSIPGADKRTKNRYLSALLKNMTQLSPQAEGYLVDSVFIGGGTPTTLPPQDLKKLIDTLYRAYFVTEDAEFTVEVNPATVSRKYAELLVAWGVNRVSIGLQSADDGELKALGRIHTVRDFEESYRILRDAGMENINLDLMYGIPTQTTESFLNTLKYAVSLDPEHISAYGLQLEPGTPFFDRRDTLALPGEDAEYSMYCYAEEYLRENGYEHYEISNYAKPGKRCRHNMKYWNSEPYLGFGAAAHSDFGGCRYGYVSDLRAYSDAIESGGSDGRIYAEREIHTPASTETEYVMLRFRLREGVDKKVYEALFGRSFDSKYAQRLEPFEAGGFIKNDADSCRLTTDGMYVSNTILSSILDF